MLAIKEYVLGLAPITAYLKRSRISPSCFVLGFQKCGSTSMYRYLSQQRGFAKAKQKEVDTMTDGTYSLGKFLSYFPNKNKGTWTANASHMMSFVPGGIEILMRDFPEAKLISIVRNPVDRAFSHYNYDKSSASDPRRRTMKIPSTFEEAVDMELKILDSVRDFADLEEIYSRTSFLNGYGMPISRGLYYYYLADFKNHGLDVLTFSIEELNANMDMVFGKVLDHIGIPKSEQVIPKSKRFNAARESEEMNPKTRKRLEEFYAIHNQRLFDLLGRNIQWN